MKRVAISIVLGLCAWPSFASVPDRASKTKLKPMIVIPQQFPAQPMQIPPTIPRQKVEPGVLDVILDLELALVNMMRGASLK